MEAHPRRLKTVFRSDVRLVVPLFQRPYVWDEDGQWAPLWEDVITTFDRREEREEDEIAPHFLGAIVLEQKRGALGSLEVREVIDGQQRLTTLQILIAALRDAYRALGVKTRLLSRLTKTLVNDADYVDSPDEEFKLWPTNRDRSAYTAVMRGDYRDSTQDPALPRIAAAYVFFREQIDAFLVRSDEDESETILDGLAEVLLEHLEVVVIDLGVDDNAQVIFETLNARGTALRASDLIKNALFRTLQDSGRPVDMLYEKYWEPLELPQWQTEVRLGRLRRPRLDIYVGFFLTVLLHREVQSHQLFTAARAYFGSDADRAEDFLTELARYARIYDQLDTGHIGTDAEQGCLTRLEIADTQTITPVLLWLFAHTDGADRQRALTLLEAYVVRRAICRLTSKNYNRLFLELLRRLSASEGPASGVIEQFLTSQDSESGLWPSDSDLRDALRSLPLYRLFKRDRLQRLLLAFEQHLTTDRTEPIPPSSKLSVEHLMPRSWHEHWALPADPAGAEDEEERRNTLLDTIGNLTLITGKLNSSLSNAAWSKKREHLLAHSALTLNRSLPTDWTTTWIERRSAMLAHAATSIWPRPAGHGDSPRRVTEAERDLMPDRGRGPDHPPQRDSTRTAAPSTRRDIGQHIVNAFADLEVGDFLTIGEIRKTPSPQYPVHDLPSAGAISARLFPGNGGRTTVPGVVGVIAGGRRGARKTG
ncbi:protein of unknown function DUF262 [Rhodococcus rhodochrous ATCC 21198]|uniref:DUF262 domain-containing protein n=1 Tax=Rhodococcus aetherivorans TaxID=191292 RepID=UPI0003E279D1|nr:DUF262 domain-containing protein [Rhodococcus aetherivorans]ETT28833.1 protein of unknown function DUF262 [Rhodococcus rhodochrous ATCC 21198]KDE11506.1 hypothetical protein N505_0125115 [Rhodococcus aetherivorans]NGP25141.1 DUF262 domain-containing protein [Rhodococcus aetherivorans]